MYLFCKYYVICIIFSFNWTHIDIAKEKKRFYFWLILSFYFKYLVHTTDRWIILQYLFFTRDRQTHFTLYYFPLHPFFHVGSFMCYAWADETFRVDWKRQRERKIILFHPISLLAWSLPIGLTLSTLIWRWYLLILKLLVYL